MVMIRRATMDDLHDIQSLNAALCAKERAEFDAAIIADYPFSAVGKMYYEQRIAAATGCMLVALIDGAIVGYLCGGLIKGESYRALPMIAELENMFVLEEHRSRGVGGELCDAFFAWCKKQGVNKVKVSASAQNAAAIAFYRRRGFQEYALVLEADL